MTLATDSTRIAAMVLDRYLDAVAEKRIAYASDDLARIDAARLAFDAALSDVDAVLNAANGRPVVYRDYVWQLGDTGLVRRPVTTPDRIKLGD